METPARTATDSIATARRDAEQAFQRTSLPIFSTETYSRESRELCPKQARGRRTSLLRKTGGLLRYLRSRRFLNQLLARRPVRNRINDFFNGISAAMGLQRSLGQPVHITIEPTNVCDQKCPICETGAGTLGRTKGMLSFDDFRRMIDQFSYAHTLFFYFMGEPFLNKQAYRMIRYAADKGIFVTTCTDGNFVDPQALVDSGIGEIHFQISGMTQEIHEIYRIGGHLDRALRSMEKIIELKNQPDSPNPSLKVIAGFILFRHNEHQAQQFIDYCRKIGVDKYNLIGTCLRTAADAHLLPTDRDHWYYDEQALANGQLVPKRRPDNYCGWIYSAANIHVNGDVVSCCRDPRGENVLGNLLETPFREIWNNDRYRALRANVSTRSNELSLCSLCPGEHLAPDPPADYLAQQPASPGVQEPRISTRAA